MNKPNTKKTLRVGSSISLLIGLVALIINLVQFGAAGLITIPVFFVGLLSTVLGVIPIAGPVVYYFGVRTLFVALHSAVGMPAQTLGSDLIFWTSFLFTCLYCFIVTLILVVFLSKRSKLKALAEEMKQKAEKGGK